MSLNLTYGRDHMKIQTLKNSRSKFSLEHKKNVKSGAKLPRSTVCILRVTDDIDVNLKKLEHLFHLIFILIK